MQVSDLVWEVIGAGLGGALTLLIVFIVMFTGKIGHLPKRIERIESMSPLMLEALLILFDVNIVELECIEGKECNGNLHEAKEKVSNFKNRVSVFLTNAAISQKERR
jgi:hypothetical protein